MSSRHNLQPREQEFFGAFSDLLKQFEDMDGKYGLWKIHEHFQINDDEVLHETSDQNKRESLTKVIKGMDLPTSAFVSQWTVVADGTIRPVR